MLLLVCCGCGLKEVLQGVSLISVACTFIWLHNLFKACTLKYNCMSNEWFCKSIWRAEDNLQRPSLSVYPIPIAQLFFIALNSKENVNNMPQNVSHVQISIKFSSRTILWLIHLEARCYVQASINLSIYDYHVDYTKSMCFETKCLL